MNKDKLSAALESLADNKTGAHQIFVKLLRQVWQIDWTVAPYDVWGHYIGYDVPYFLRFMRADVGDEEEEKQLLLDWISSRYDLQKDTQGSNFRYELIGLLDELNQLRVEARKG